MDRRFHAIRAYHTEGLVKLFDPIIIGKLNKIVRDTCSSLTLSYQEGCQQQIETDIKFGATFITNHRDIVLDSVFLSLLLNNKYDIRPYIAIGNNLLKKWWIRHFVRMNRAFIVIRDGSVRSKLQNASLLSEYIHLLRFSNKSIWIAQREGRAKDGNDLTQPSVLKMLCLYPMNDVSTTAIIDKLIRLNLCPVSISYQYDPCDYLKVSEQQLKRDDPNWKKSAEDDILSMKTGIKGDKGDVVFRLTPSINSWLRTHRDELCSLNVNDALQKVAERIDYQIHYNYEIFDQDALFDEYIEQQLDKISIPNRDMPFLKEKMLELYTNPKKNYENSHLPR